MYNMMGNFRGMFGCGYGQGSGSWSGFGFGWIFTLIIWGLIIWAAIALVKWLLRYSKGGFASKEKTPLDILKERYAKGEINKEEFEQRKKDIER